MLHQSSAHAFDSQVIAIANCYDLAYWDPCDRNLLSYDELIDDAHCGQKAKFWLHNGTIPNVVIAPNQISATGHSDSVVDISPPAVSTSVVDNLLRDDHSRRRLLVSLDRRKPVTLLPHIYSDQVARLLSWLEDSGYEVTDCSPQISLVRNLCSKVFTHLNIFRQSSELLTVRPRVEIAENVNGLHDAVDKMADIGVKRLAIKSSFAVAGMGTFFVDTLAAKEASNIESLMRSTSGGSAVVAPPFIVEEYIESIFSPTIDVVIDSKGQVTVEGMAIQRLRESKYYSGFYFSPAMLKTAWYESLLATANILCRSLFARGYIGPVNIDFVVTDKCAVKLIELNPRRSALFDGFQLANRLHGHWSERSVSTLDHIFCPSLISPRRAEQTMQSICNRSEFRVVSATRLRKGQLLAAWVSSLCANSEKLLRDASAMLEMGTAAGLEASGRAASRDGCSLLGPQPFYHKLQWESTATALSRVEA